MVVDRPRREEQPGADLAVAQAFGDEAADRQLLRRELAGRGRNPAAGVLSRRAQLAVRARRPRLGSDVLERLERAAERRPCVHAPARPAQRLAVGQLRARALERPAVAVQRGGALEMPVALGLGRQPARALGQALDPGQLRDRRELLELRARSHGVVGAVELHRNLARLARPARRQPGVRHARERVGGSFVAAHPDLVQRRGVRRDRLHLAQAVVGGERARLARGGREARRDATDGGRARRGRGWLRGSSSGRIRARGAPSSAADAAPIRRPAS